MTGLLFAQASFDDGEYRFSCLGKSEDESPYRFELIINQEDDIIQAIKKDSQTKELRGWGFLVDDNSFALRFEEGKSRNTLKYFKFNDDAYLLGRWKSYDTHDKKWQIGYEVCLLTRGVNNSLN